MPTTWRPSIRNVHLGKAYVVGHSYGALTALFLAIRHPELVRAMVLAEPPGVTLLRHLPDEQAEKGDELYGGPRMRRTEYLSAMSRGFVAGAFWDKLTTRHSFCILEKRHPIIGI